MHRHPLTGNEGEHRPKTINATVVDWAKVPRASYMIKGRPLPDNCSKGIIGILVGLRR